VRKRRPSLICKRRCPQKAQQRQTNRPCFYLITTPSPQRRPLVYLNIKLKLTISQITRRACSRQSAFFGLKRGNATFRQVRQTLARMCSGAQRCAYCEDSVGDEVEHIEPKDLYPNKTFVWENYLFSCGPCNTGKSNKFSIINGNNNLENVTRKRNDPIAPPRPGRQAFVNPRVEDPLRFLELEIVSTFAFLPRDGAPDLDILRAEFTISSLKLNRDVLLRARANAFGSYRARLTEFIRHRDSGAAAFDLNKLIEGIKTMPHPTVWAEIKRQHLLIANLRNLFDDAPEALTW
jgi:uncharacterized protein (TIGR02646 family)